jgi:hypothetical protein
MRLVASCIPLVLLAFTTECTPARHPGTSSTNPRAPECPGTHAVCLVAPECVYDPVRDCNACHCGAPTQAPPEGGGVPPIQ